MFLIEWGDKPPPPSPFPSTPFASNTPKMLKKLLDFAISRKKVFYKIVRIIESRKILRIYSNISYVVYNIKTVGFNKAV